jgi:hypothetical protein
MGQVTPIRHSREGTLAEPEKGLATSLYDLLYKLFRGSPRWIQLVVLSGIAAFGAIYALQFLGLIKPHNRIIRAAQAYSLEDGKQAAGPGNASMADVSLHLAEEDAHSRWHHEHPEDSPPMKPIFKISEDNYLAYQFYDKSDHCVYVLRRENGVTTSRWVDPTCISRGAWE